MKEPNNYQAKVGDLVLFTPKGGHSSVTCFAVAIGEDLFNKYASNDIKSACNLESRPNPVFLFRIGNDPDLDGRAVYRFGYAIPSWGEIRWLCSVFDKEKFGDFIYYLECVDLLGSNDKKSQVSFINNQYQLLNDIYFELQKPQPDSSAMYGKFLRYLHDFRENRIPTILDEVVIEKKPETIKKQVRFFKRKFHEFLKVFTNLWEQVVRNRG